MHTHFPSQRSESACSTKASAHGGKTKQKGGSGDGTEHGRIAPCSEVGARGYLLFCAKRRIIDRLIFDQASLSSRLLNSLHNSNLHNIRNAFAKQQLTYPVTVHYKAFSVRNDLLLYPNSLHNSVHIITILRTAVQSLPWCSRSGCSGRPHSR